MSNGFGLGSRYTQNRDEDAQRQLLSELPDQNRLDLNLNEHHEGAWNYEALWLDLFYDSYVNETAMQHARTVRLIGIDVLPDLLEEEMCADNQSDVWSLQPLVFSKEHAPDSDLEPWWERLIPIPGLP